MSGHSILVCEVRICFKQHLSAIFIVRYRLKSRESFTKIKSYSTFSADSCTTSRLSPIAVAPPSEQDRPGSLTGGYGLPPGLPQVFLPPVLTPPPGLPSPPGLLHPPGLGAPPGLPHPPGLPLPPPGIPFRISRDSGIAGDHSPTESEEAEKVCFTI